MNKIKDVEVPEQLVYKIEDQQVPEVSFLLTTQDLQDPGQMFRPKIHHAQLVCRRNIDWIGSSISRIYGQNENIGAKITQDISNIGYCVSQIPDLLDCGRCLTELFNFSLSETSDMIISKKKYRVNLFKIFCVLRRSAAHLLRNHLAFHEYL